MRLDLGPLKRFAIGMLLGTAIVLAMLSCTQSPAFAQEDTVQIDTGVVVVDEWKFGANKREIFHEQYIIPQPDVGTCVAEAAAEQTRLQTAEATQAAAVNAQNWDVKSRATCYVMSTTINVPPTQVVSGDVCVVTYEAGKTYEQLMAEQCSG